jgi:hypothetical protein
VPKRRQGPFKHPQFYTPEERISIMQKLRAEGKSYAGIGRLMNCDGGSIHYHLRRYGEENDLLD